MNMPNDMPIDLLASAIAGQKIDRRGFLTFAARGLALAFVLPLAGRIGEAEAAAPPPTATELANAFIRIGDDGSITLAFGGAEMGQGSMSGLPHILAEELKVDWDQITVRQAVVEANVSYTTAGSGAVSKRYATLRKAGAAARELLIAAAMLETHDTDRALYTAKSAQVIYSGGTTTTWDYADLATAAAGDDAKALFQSLLAPSGDPPLTDPADFGLIGKRLPRVDIPSKVDGSAEYGIDVWFPDMVFATIKHCPTIGGTLLPANFPAKPRTALAVVPCTASDTRGKVVAGTCNAVAVVATNSWLARKLANSLSVKWTLPAATGDVDSAQILATAQQLMDTGTPLVAEPAPAPAGIAGAVNDALGTPPTVESTYTLPYLAHATMEVLNCTVKITYDSAGAPSGCEIWAPTQAAGSVANTAANLLKPYVPASAVIVHTTFLGGGLGRKIEQDYIAQAIQVAMAVKATVKTTWWREEDFGHDQYRPFALAKVKATLTSPAAGGMIKAWSYRTVTQSISWQRGRGLGSVDSQAVEGAVHLPYALGTSMVEWVPLNMAPNQGIPVGYWRSVGASVNVFAVESMMDELAAAAGNTDPFTFRANHLVNSPRAAAVLDTADKMTSSWRRSLPNTHAWGMAISQAFGTWVCEVVEISQPAAGSLKVHRVDCFVDCGTVINPDSVEAQMQGSIVHALNATLWGQTTFTAGKANQLNFNKYRVMRLSEMPQVTVQIIASSEPPSGVGEPGVPPLAPALANAYARLATGTRIRELPFFPGARMGGL